jgi:cytoskeletal protein RodZ
MRPTPQSADFTRLPMAGQNRYRWAVMPTVAEQLRTAREIHGLTIYQVAEVTKIKTDHVRALEEGNYDAFAAPVYIRGFVRTYGNLVKLDGAALMNALDAELGRTERFHEPPPLSNEPRGFLDLVMLQLSKVNWRLALPSLAAAVALLALVLGYRAWRGHQAKDPLSHLGPGLYQPSQKQSGDTLPLPGTPTKK